MSSSITLLNVHIAGLVWHQCNLWGSRVWLSYRLTAFLPLHYTLYILMHSIYSLIFLFSFTLQKSKTLTDFLLLKCALALHSLQLDNAIWFIFFPKSAA